MFGVCTCYMVVVHSGSVEVEAVVHSGSVEVVEAAVVRSESA